MSRSMWCIWSGVASACLGGYGPREACCAVEGGFEKEVLIVYMGELMLAVAEGLSRLESLEVLV
jgi:hypothetical protein